MATLNFCRSDLGTRITTRTVSADGHGVDTLIQSGPGTQAAPGFLAESFIRPPVSIALHFVTNIDIDRIIISGRVGMQRACAFEIHLNCNRVGAKSISEFSSAPLDPSSVVYTNAAYASSPGSHLFCFKNPRFSPRTPYSNVRREPSQLGVQACVTRELRTLPPLNLHHVSHMTVRLTRTEGSSVPAIGWIEVWAQPSTSCPPELVRDILNVCQKSSTTDANATPSTPVRGRAGGGRATVRDVHQNETQQELIPTEFLDPLTEEIMSLPILLPSGHTVDQRSLERHNGAQAHWGRSPSDPFTGLPFTESSKPLPNTALKLRIDEFLLRHGHLSQVTDAGRTLGTADQYQNQEGRSLGPPVSSRLIAGRTMRETPTMCVTKQAECDNIRTKGSTSKQCLLHDTPSVRTDSSLLSKSAGSSVYEKITSGRKRKAEDDIGHTAIRTSSLTHTSSHKVERTSNKAVSVIDLTADGKVVDDMGVEGVIVDLTDDITESQGNVPAVSNNSSANDALEAVLHGLPSFASKGSASSGTVASSDVGMCVQCRKSRADYQTPCDHLICRPCLTTERLRHLLCKQCQTKFNTQHVIKIHRA